MRSVSQPVESDPSEGSFADTRVGLQLESENKREIEVDVQRKEVGVQVNMDESVTGDQTKDSRIGENEPSTWSTATWKGAKWGKVKKKKVRGLKGKKKREYWNRKELSSGGGVDSSSGIDRPKCLRCGRFHKGVCLVGMTGCYRCGQEGHVIRECRTMPWMIQSRQTFSGRDVQQGIVPSDSVVPGMLILRVLMCMVLLWTLVGLREIDQKKKKRKRKSNSDL